jgi:hypothetical protein
MVRFFFRLNWTKLMFGYEMEDTFLGGTEMKIKTSW